MSQRSQAPSRARVELMHWTARIGAVTAEALALRLEGTPTAARARLRSAEREGLLMRWRLLAAEPALYTVTRSGMKASALRGLDPVRVSATNARHLSTCAWVAAALERCYPDHLLMGERELRRDERERGTALASASVGMRPDGGRALHRPDLVLWPQREDGALPVAVEVELSVKAAQRLAAICQAWARCRCVAGVLYLVTAEVQPALERAIEVSAAGEQIVVVGLDAVSGTAGAAKHPLGGSIPSDA